MLRAILQHIFFFILTAFLWIKDTDDTRRAKREKLQIRREMPPEVLEHMARIYDLPHGASPAHGMSACSLSEVAIDMSMYKSLPLDEVINQVKECNFSERNSSSGIPKYLFELEKITKELDRGSRHPRHKFTGH
ncbi:hypothetical protein BIW11_09243 [Tropilaelaps mercedesae]|uniref:Uncharacterized protein n=1 Tax=Tropilaelaps mercedesae TaxID=418985 RepID=A0A1V9XLB4_9ACAR|nr:hypothetical protein BIW11_09243 [Tropilaelaps mercedesae]